MSDSSLYELTAERAVALGAIVVARSNTPEFAAGASTFNPVLGRTANPWDPSRSVAGSSGGSAAALASGQVWLALTGAELAAAEAGRLRIMASHPLRTMMRGITLLLLLVAAVLNAQAEDLLGTDAQVARLDVCFDFGCKSSKRVYVFEEEWREVAATLRGSRTPAEERYRIAHAVGAMERLVGAVTPTDVDRGSNGYEGDDPAGQMDCIDESTNTTAYLKLFQSQRLLRFHSVMERAYRAPAVLDQHWAAQVEETGTGRRFAVDSWYRDNGEPAVVQSLEHWYQERQPPREPDVPPAATAGSRQVVMDAGDGPPAR